MLLKELTVYEQNILLILNDITEIKDIRKQNPMLIKGRWWDLYRSIERLKAIRQITVRKRFDKIDIKITDKGKETVKDSLNMLREEPWRSGMQH